MDAQMLLVRQSFFLESRELLQSMESILLQAEGGECDACDSEAINALFRCAHTIKGSAGLFGLDSIVRFTHSVESVLDQVREGAVALSNDLAGLLLECSDHISRLIDLACEMADETDIVLDEQTRDTGASLQALLAEYLAPAKSAPGEERGLPVEVPELVETIAVEAVEADAWHISLRFGPNVFRNGMDPLGFVAYLGEVGEVRHVTTLADAMPLGEEFDPETCYLGFEIDLKSSATKAAIESVFDFVAEDCEIRIIPPFSALDEYVRLIEELPESESRIGEILVRGGALTERELERALAKQHAEEEKRRPIGEILIADGLAEPQVVQAALDKQRSSAAKRAAETQVLKVAADRLDALINLVGELVISGATTASLATRNGDAALIESAGVFLRLVEEIRDAALRMRMVPISETFARFPRVVRDVSRELGKEIELQISGGDTELDKSMMELIGDPLMHLVRNAIDHGIEPAAARIAMGKPATGVLRLNAYHDSGSVILEVCDDGGGLKRDRIRAKALERGLISSEQVLSERDIYRLIFEPGFSTAAEVTNLSGRGVGMDVVKRNIETMRGSIEVDSEEGKGTTIRLRLPLTLAIIDGFVVSIGKDFYVIPLDMVLECMELKGVAADAHYLNLRGEVLPFVRLRDLFELEPPSGGLRHENVVVVRCGGRKAGIVVDVLHGEAQTVIKPLPALFKRLRGISGSTILGGGEVALILDVMMLTELAAAAEETARLLSYQGERAPRSNRTLSIGQS